jgi:methylated-DNA-[protein]-cysteine S-methyltransferase
MKYRLVRSPLGNVIVASDREGLRKVDFEQGRYGRVPIPEDWENDPSFPLLRRAAEALTLYFEGKLRRFSLPLAPVGTPFQERVWKELLRIPYGKTLSYTELARRVGRPEAIRAAGSANARNPISIVIPCHRVVGKNGCLTGYGGGLEKKRALLALEGGVAPRHLRPGPSRVHPGTIWVEP